MSLWTSTCLANGAVVRHRRIPSLPRVGATSLSIGLQAYRMNQAGQHEEAERLIRNFEIMTGLAADQEET